MIRRPPRSPLFPSTPLSRSPVSLRRHRRARQHDRGLDLSLTVTAQDAFNNTVTGYTGQRSEEHTSELQSRLHLVCRLLLEKKKKIASTTCVARVYIHTTIGV